MIILICDSIVTVVEKPVPSWCNFWKNRLGDSHSIKFDGTAKDGDLMWADGKSRLSKSRKCTDYHLPGLLGERKFALYFEMHYRLNIDLH